MNDDATLRSKSSKLRGMATFGSPLDKIAFFFDEHINKEKQPLRYAMVSHLHGFRRKNVDGTLPTSIRWLLGEIPWFNFWTPTDVVSGRLDVYQDVTNIKMDFSDRYKGKSISGSKLFIFSHCLYWRSAVMYETILRSLVLPAIARVKDEKAVVNQGALAPQGVSPHAPVFTPSIVVAGDTEIPEGKPDDELEWSI